MEWTMVPVLEHIKDKPTETLHSFLSALVDVLSYKEKIEELKNFPEWINVEPDEIK